MFVTEMEKKEFDSIDRSTIKFGIIAGAAMPPELLRRIVSQSVAMECRARLTLSGDEIPRPKAVYVLGHDRAKLIRDHDA